MKKHFMFIGLNLAIMLCLNHLLLAESIDHVCGLTSNATGASYVPTTGTSKALIVFVQFSDDTFGSGTGGGAECTQDDATEWPYDKGDIPSWAFDVIDDSDSGTHTPTSLTDYFCKMSRDRNDGTHGKFHLVGEVYPELIVPDHPKSWYQDTTNHGFENEWVAVNREILQKVDSDSQGIHLSDFDDYTNGTTTRTPDGVFDMVIMAFRSHFGGFAGVSNLDGDPSGGTSTDFGSTLQVGGLDIDGHFTDGSGVITRAGSSQKSFVTLAAHEYMHRIIGPWSFCQHW